MIWKLTKKMLGEAVMSKGRMGREYTKIITLPDYADAKKYVIETLPAYV